MEQQNPDCFSSNVRRQFALNGFFRYQSHRPTSASLGRLAKHHGDDALFLTVVEQRLGSRPGPVIQRCVEAAFFVAVADLADGLDCQRYTLCYCGRARASSQLQ